MKFSLVLAALLMTTVAQARITCVGSVNGTEKVLRPSKTPNSFTGRIGDSVFTAILTGINDKTQELYIAIDIDSENRGVVAYFSKVGGTLQDTKTNSSLTCKQK